MGCPNWYILYCSRAISAHNAKRGSRWREEHYFKAKHAHKRTKEEIYKCIENNEAGLDLDITETL